MVTKTEREELRRVIRAQFKVLRADVEQRQAELLTELEATIQRRFADADKAWADAMYLIEEAGREANRKANDILRGLELEDYNRPGVDFGIVSVSHIRRPTGDRAALQRLGVRDIDAKVKAALLELDRREVELLSELAMTALETVEARNFMVRIPTVSELVPASRLLQIEAELSSDPPERTP